MKNKVSILFLILLVVAGLYMARKDSFHFSDAENISAVQVEEVQLKNHKVELSLNNVTLKAEERILNIVKLDVTHEEARVALLDFIISPNPHEDELRDADHHSMEVLNYEKEQALRIFGIRKLSENLSLNEFKKSVSFIVNHSHDDSLTELAQLSLEARLKGENYFENMIAAFEQDEVLNE